MCSVAVFCSRFCKLSSWIFMRHAESEIASSSSSCCPESFSVQRPECTCGKPWRVGRRRLGDCHRGVRNSRRKQGAGDSATSHRPRERAVRRVHMGTWRDSIHGRVGKRSVLPRRRRRPWERTLVQQRATPFARSTIRTYTAESDAWCRAGKSTRSGPASEAW